MTAPRPLEGVEIRTDAEVVYCRSCGSEVWWGETRDGKRCPFDVQDGKHTAISHFATCPDARRWTKR